MIQRLGTARVGRTETSGGRSDAKYRQDSRRLQRGTRDAADQGGAAGLANLPGDGRDERCVCGYCRGDWCKQLGTEAGHSAVIRLRTAAGRIDHGTVFLTVPPRADIDDDHGSDRPEVAIRKSVDLVRRVERPRDPVLGDCIRVVGDSVGPVRPEHLRRDGHDLYHVARCGSGPDLRHGLPRRRGGARIGVTASYGIDVVSGCARLILADRQPEQAGSDEKGRPGKRHAPDWGKAAMCTCDHRLHPRICLQEETISRL